MMNKVAFIYQVQKNIREVAFSDFSDVVAHNAFDFYNYAEVAHIDLLANHLVGNTNAETLENIFLYGNNSDDFYKNNPMARSISVSDIINIDDRYYYCNSIGFEDISNAILDVLENENKNTLEEAEDIDGESENEDSNEKLADVDIEDDVEDDVEAKAEEENQKDLLEMLQDRIGQSMSVGELNALLQSLFARYNKVFLMTSDLFNMDLDDTQELVVDDDEDMYVIKYDIVDMDEGIIAITDVSLEN